MKRPAVTELMKSLRRDGPGSHGMLLLGWATDEAIGTELAKLLLALATAVVATLLTPLADGNTPDEVVLYVCVMNDMAVVQRHRGEQSGQRDVSICGCAIYWGGGGGAGQAAPANTESISLVDSASDCGRGCH